MGCRIECQNLVTNRIASGRFTAATAHTIQQSQEEQKYLSTTLEGQAVTQTRAVQPGRSHELEQKRGPDFQNFKSGAVPKAGMLILVSTTMRSIFLPLE